MSLSKKMQQPKKNSKGFTLIETLIAVLLFSLLSVMVSGVFSSFLKNYTESKKTLQGVEGGQFAMNLMAKTIRVSDVKAEGTNILQVYDFSQAKCLKYSWDSVGKKMQASYSTEAGQGTVDKCAFTSMGGAQDLTAADVQSASFKVVPSTPTTLGFVIIALTIKDDTQTSAPMQIQMAVSLRNYKPN